MSIEHLPPEQYRAAFRLIINIVWRLRSAAWISNEFATSMPTVARWCAGISSPHPMMSNSLMTILEKESIGITLGDLARQGLALDLQDGIARQVE